MAILPDLTSPLGRVLAGLLSLALLTTTVPAVRADSATWTNADPVNDDWANDANWNLGPYPGSLVTSETMDFATFNDDQAATGNPILNDNETIGGFIFNTGGWTISGLGSLILLGDTADHESKSVTGTNIISVDTRFQADNGVWMDISSGSTMVFNGGIDLFRQIRPSGGGTLVLEGTQMTLDPMETEFDITQMAIDMKNRSFAGKLLLNYDALVSFTGSNTDSRANYIVNDGATLGGTGSVTFTVSDRTVRVESGGTLSPGGDGKGDTKIETFNINTIDTSVIMETGSKLSVNLGLTAGISDVLGITSANDDGGHLNLATNVTLDLWGDINQAAGTYTFAIFDTVPDGSSTYGTFSTINFNGSTLDPAFGQVIYGTDRISFIRFPVQN